MDAFDERILGDDETVAELGRVVLDPARETAALELGEQAELAEVREPHAPRSPGRRPGRRRLRSRPDPGRPPSRRCGPPPARLLRASGLSRAARPASPSACNPHR